MRASLQAEWTKLRTVRSTGWLVLAIVGFTVLVSTLAAWSVNTSQCAPPPTGCEEDTIKLSLSGVYLGQMAVMVLATLAVTSEYGTETMRVTLAANPRRAVVLLAKAGVVTAIVLGASLLGVLGSLLAGRGVLPGNGFTAAAGYPPLSLADEPTRRAALGTVFYCGLIGLLSVGVGMIVRYTGAALTTVFSLLFVSPIAAQLLTNEHVRRLVMKYSPMTAGLGIQATRGLDRLPIGPWAGLGVLAAYAGVAMLAALILFKVRDA
jgi:ABC-2 type transport system permease protein